VNRNRLLCRQAVNKNVALLSHMPVLFTLNGVRGRKPVRACRFFDGGDAAHHVLKAGFVGLVVGDVFDWRGTTCAVLHCPGQVFDGDFLSVADVNDFADGADSKRIRPSTVSRMSQKQRDCFPVPSKLMGASSSVCRTSGGTRVSSRSSTRDARWPVTPCCSASASKLAQSTDASEPASRWQS
jgi:hypothetical protein